MHLRNQLCAYVLAVGAVVTPARADEWSAVSALRDRGETMAALVRAEGFLAGRPGDAQMRFLRGVLLADLRRADEAAAVFRSLIQDHPDLPEPYNNLAALHASAGDYDAARGALEQALRADPAYSVAHENLGDVYAMLASLAYARVVQLDTGNRSVLPKLTLVRRLFEPAAR